MVPQDHDTPGPQPLSSSFPDPGSPDLELPFLTCGFCPRGIITVVATLGEGEVREVEILLRDKAYCTVLVPSLLTQKYEQTEDMPQQSIARALFHSGF